jgi:hypothetical protein
VLLERPTTIAGILRNIVKAAAAIEGMKLTEM